MFSVTIPICKGIHCKLNLQIKWPYLCCHNIKALPPFPSLHRNHEFASCSGNAAMALFFSAKTYCLMSKTEVKLNPDNTAIFFFSSNMHYSLDELVCCFTV